MMELLAGASRTEIKFGQTWDRTVGKAISIVSRVALMAFWQLIAVSRKRSMEAREEEVLAAKAA
jgi:hypothetical protein